MTWRARLSLTLIVLALAATVGVSRAQAVRASAHETSARAAQAASVGRELREGQEALATALRDVNASRFDEAERELTLARRLLGHARGELIALGRSRESGQVLALLEGIEVARGLIVRMTVTEFEAERAAAAGPQL